MIISTCVAPIVLAGGHGDNGHAKPPGYGSKAVSRHQKPEGNGKAIIRR